MSAKKRGQSHAETPFDTQTVAAITRDIPGLLAKAGYFNEQSKTNQPKQSVPAKAEIKADMFNHALIETRFPEEKAESKIEKLTVPQPIPRGNRLKLLYAVVGFGLTILSIWIFNVRNTVSGLWSDATTKHEIIDQGTADFNTVLESINNNDRIMREKLNEADAAAPLDPFTQATVEAALQQAIKPNP